MTIRGWFIIILLLMFVATIGVATIYLRAPQTQPVNTVVISGELSHISKNNLIRAIRPLFRNKNFFTVKIEAIKSKLQGLPWVQYATVQRQWPDHIRIGIQPQQPQAIWNRNGLVNRYGEVFYAHTASSFQDLPHFVASNSNDRLALEILAKYRHMMHDLQSIPLKISTVKVNSDHSWQVTLNNGVKLKLGQSDILTKVAHFVKVYPEVFATSKKKAKSVNLLYKHGMAVEWAK